MANAVAAFRSGLSKVQRLHSLSSVEFQRQLTYNKRMAKDLFVQQPTSQPIASRSEMFDPNRGVD